MEVCKVKDCNDYPRTRGYCGKHYARIRRHGNPNTVKQVRYQNGRCVARISKDLRCRKAAYSKELCTMHYQRLRKNGYFESYRQTERNPKNYIAIYKPNHPNSNQRGFILEHRFVMSEHLGRALYKDENVHHINGDRHDNRIENLELWSSAQPKGQRIEDKLQWAIMILRRYAYSQETTDVSQVK